ncbi:MAG: phosphoribosylglycinamide formyltransferase [Candidatus Portnoybacteria bacterium RIFCSPLOWO2_12_FULL_39_9]|uniref:Phosphoribosylglycinamide formyltransferase n=1 Tax=Candidatus Portnoybacteria bacterium RIFCSPHIGHO2_12_FULL_38_9 TaxID=1801997 RepID=A0A1G2FJ06_9BACT|nr:MAG: phosphoribosylglycinamide formyltransferase [Candidatus Portnoybacteria bacterium RBG_13_40_8]OGZ36617.1 MAG: phosphoribosylglycinamide formyltransferase [Candidatus Portnoybacteria bacterium RIFCSPHIGHO2_02_FULL_39_12]OGZ37511.1 MAG: phosphoribosylglycinamide formyltransferase [Candidatus Portnoybacteria bacterium RIFCSPHIGHO2_12_FULL_38_9]OGZ39851.1 MAG: phosphoribosylglycinamide formyltransferase [Candidatus Portnoybacteria bacterium RIFCSPLOWO2_12_FULL_39_9]
MKNKKIRLALLIGRGGRLAAVYERAKNNPLVDLVLVVSHKKESPGIDWAKERGLEAIYFRLNDWQAAGQDRKSYNLELAKILKQRKINLVVMAGWDLIMSNEFLKEFPGAVMNIHPSLCPAFPGLDSEKQALDYGVKYTGATLHFVPDDGVDTGPIILQRVVPIEPNETVETLQEKIHQEENEILCQGIKLFAEGKLKIEGRKVIIKNGFLFF